MVYMLTLKKMVISSNVQHHKDQEKVFKFFKDYCWRLIKRIKQETFLDIQQEMMKKACLLFFLSELINGAIIKSDYQTAAQAYLQFTQYTEDVFSICGEAPELMILFKEMARPIERLINVATDMTQKNNTLSISHPKQVEVYAKAMALANDHEPCLIIGETGTGKESIAQVIHDFSQRKKNVFWSVNCGGFTDSLYNSQIQGILKGTATNVGTRLGAFLTTCGREEVGDKDHRFGYYIKKDDQIDFNPLPEKIKESKDENSDLSPEQQKEEQFKKQLKELAGTLFFDEVNSLLDHHQASLLRIIQEKKVEVGGEDKQRPFDLKLVCASNAKLDVMIQEGKFREDLYYRIARGVIELPPLRDLEDTMDDIVDKQIARLCIKIGLNDKPTVTKSAINKLKKYEWPGNLRELENVMYRSLKQMVINNDKKLMPKHIELLFKKHKISNELNFGDIEYEDVKKSYVEHMLNLSNGNKIQAAKKADIEKSKFQRMVKKYNL